MIPILALLNKPSSELEELKSWRDELNGNYSRLNKQSKILGRKKKIKRILKKGIERATKPMLHQLLVGIDFDKER